MDGPAEPVRSYTGTLPVRLPHVKTKPSSHLHTLDFSLLLFASAPLFSLSLEDAAIKVSMNHARHRIGVICDALH